VSFFDKIGFNKLKDGLIKTKDGLMGKVNRLISARKKIDDEFLNELEEIFLLSDMGLDTAEKIIENIKERAKTDKYEDEQELNKIITEEIKKIFSETTSQFKSFCYNGCRCQWCW
jgi:fused signal recognition particle receptor